MNKRDPKSVVVVVATGNGTTRWETMTSLINVALSKIGDYKFEMIPAGGCDVAHARNLGLHYARTRSDAGIILYADSDVVFGAEHVAKLIAWFEHPDVRYIGGLYPLKGMELRWGYGGWAKESVKHLGLWEVFELTTGFTAIRLDLIDELIAAHPEWAYIAEDYAYKGETAHEVFAMGPVTREWAPGHTYSRRMPEDFTFSLRAREHGETIYVDPKIQLGHIGTMDMIKLHKPGSKELTQGHA